MIVQTNELKSVSLGISVQFGNPDVYSVIKILVLLLMSEDL